MLQVKINKQQINQIVIRAPNPDIDHELVYVKPAPYGGIVHHDFLIVWDPKRKVVYVTPFQKRPFCPFWGPKVPFFPL